MKATLALGLILIIAQAHACEVSVPANLQTDCRAIRVPIYDACMRRFWRNADKYYANFAWSYFETDSWPSLVLVQEACVAEAVGVTPRRPAQKRSGGRWRRAPIKQTQPAHNTKGQ
jgi:hypothetical protein